MDFMFSHLALKLKNLTLDSQNVIFKPKFDDLSNGVGIISKFLQGKCSIFQLVGKKVGISHSKLKYMGMTNGLK